MTYAMGAESCDIFRVKRQHFITFCQLEGGQYIIFCLPSEHPRGHYRCVFFNMGVPGWGCHTHTLSIMGHALGGAFKCAYRNLEGKGFPVFHLFFILFYFIFLFLNIFWAFMALLIEHLKIWQETGREREGGNDMQQRDPGRELNPGLLQSPGTWDARSNPLSWTANFCSFFLFIYDVCLRLWQKHKLLLFIFHDKKQLYPPENVPTAVYRSKIPACIFQWTEIFPSSHLQWELKGLRRAWRLLTLNILWTSFLVTVINFRWKYKVIEAVKK